MRRTRMIKKIINNAMLNNPGKPSSSAMPVCPRLEAVGTGVEVAELEGPEVAVFGMAVLVAVIVAVAVAAANLVC